MVGMCAIRGMQAWEAFCLNGQYLSCARRVDNAPGYHIIKQVGEMTLYRVWKPRARWEVES